LFDQFCERLARVGLAKQQQETGLRFVHRIERLLDPDSADQAKRFVRTYYPLRYSKPQTEPSLKPKEDQQGMRHLQEILAKFRP
jgi:hypothetical protein